MRRSRGFTLIELMIVVAIIAILASIAVAVYMNSTGKSQLSEAFTLVDGLKTDVSNYYDQTGSCPVLGSNGFNASTSYTGKYVASVSITPGVAGCSIIALMRSGTISPHLQGKQVTFAMTDNGGSVSWRCSSDADPIYLPATCQ
jgi:type IV pilus assembly protein PilA